MKDFLRTKDVSSLLAEEKATREASEEISKILSKMGGMSFPEKGTIEAAISKVSNKWVVWNFFTNIRDYMT